MLEASQTLNAAIEQFPCLSSADLITENYSRENHLNTTKVHQSTQLVL